MLSRSVPAGRRELATAVVLAGYNICGVAVWGRTLGKLAAGARVISASNGTTPGWGRSIKRWAVPAVGGFAAILSGLGVVLGILWTYAVYLLSHSVPATKVSMTG